MSDFHWLRPHWLWLLLLLLPIAYLWWRSTRKQFAAQQWLAPHLAPLLLTTPQQSRGPWRWLSLVFGVTIASLALAGPAWERLPQPVYQLNAGQVIVLDMSLSTRATDIKPDRLSQLRYKARDLLRTELDGETGLIAYAGDAFAISPLTTDKSNLLNLIPSLTPEIMPEQGNYPQRALQEADRMLRDAGYPQGDIYWFTDGIESRDLSELTQQLRNLEHRVSILAVGTEQGAPVRLTDGSLLREANGQVVVPKTYSERLQKLAELTGGVFTRVQVDDSDIALLTAQTPLSRSEKAQAESNLQQGDQWLDRGPWVALLLLPLLLPLWRRHGVFHSISLPLLLGILVVSSGYTGIAHAQSDNADASADAAADDRLLQNLWLTKEQQAQRALDAKDYQRAATLSEDPLRRGTAHFRNQNYEAALTDFAQVDSAEGWYNQGNSLMHLEDYEGAVNAYEAALERNPNWSQAEDNLNLAKERLAQQQTDDQQQSAEQDQGENPSSEQSENGDSDSQQQSEQGQDSEANNNDSSAEEESEAPQPGDQEQDGNNEEDEATESEGEAQENAEGQEADAEDSERALPQIEGETLSDEQQREFEQMLNRLPDDAGYLLRQKMRLEHQRRQQQRRPEGVQREW